MKRIWSKLSIKTKIIFTAIFISGFILVCVCILSAVLVTGIFKDYAGIFISAFILGIISLSIFLAALLAKTIVTPIDKICEGVERIKEGDLNYRIEIESNDESKVLAEEYNRMAERLKESYDTLDENIEKKTKKLALLNELAIIVSSPLTLNEKAGKILSKLNCYYPNFGNGIIYKLDREDETLTLVASRNVPKKLLKEFENLHIGEGISGIAAQKGETIVINDIGKFNVSKRGLLLTAGVQRVIAVPLKSKDKVYGVLTITKGKDSQFTDEEIEMLSEIAASLAISFESLDYINQIIQEKLNWDATFDALPDFISIHDAGFKILKMNKALKEAFSLADVDMKNRICCSVMHGYSFPCEKCPLKESFSELKQVTRIIDDFKVPGKFEVTTSPLYGPDGNILGCVHIARNITERALMIEELSNQMNFAKTLIQNIDDCIFTMKFDGTITWISNKIRDIAGYEPEELIGRYGIEVIVDEDKKTAIDKFKEMRKEQRTKIFELRLKHKDGGAKVVLFSISPVFFEEDETTLILVIAKDITSLKLIDEKVKQGDKLRTMGQLAAGVAHDFNNILTAILGRTQLLKLKFESGGVDSYEAVSKLKIIEEAAVDGANVVKKIQEFSRSKSTESYEEVDINSIITKTVEITSSKWKDEAQKKGKLVKVSTNLINLPVIHGNTSELKEVFSNLVINAVDAIHNNNGKVLISTFFDENFVYIKVEDNGEGIADDIKEKIFEPFFTTKGAEGTGLGLSICYSIIDRHDGEITVESLPGAGTTFTIKLPVDKKENVVYNLPFSKTLPVKKKMKKILVIDDEDSVRSVLREFLEVLGNSVIEASSGEDGIRLFKAESPAFDAIFTDLGMPGLSGWDVIEAIREINSTVPIIVVTGWGETITKEVVQEKGANSLISKPFNIQTLTDSLERA